MKTKAFILACALTANAQVFDQGFDNDVFGGNAVYEWNRLGQTFTVGIEGLLSEVRLDLFRSEGTHSGVFMSIRKFGSDDIYAIEYIYPNSIPIGMVNAEMVSVPLSNPIGLELDSEWAIYLSPTGPLFDPAVNWTRDPAGPYGNGFAYAEDDQGNTWNLGATDQSFLTFMTAQEVTGDPSPIPEPTTYAAIFGLGLAGFAAWRRVRG